MFSGEPSIWPFDWQRWTVSLSGDPVGTRQFGTAAGDAAYSVSVDALGNVVVAGCTEGTLLGELSAGGRDAFVRKYDGDGALLWTRQFGTDLQDLGYSVGVDRGAGTVSVAGRTSGTLNGETSAGEGDALVLTYDASGVLLWMQQLGSSGQDAALALSVGGGA